MNKHKDFFKQQATYYINASKSKKQKYHINRKIEHSKRVNELAIKISKKLNLEKEEIKIIDIASLLHDIARFKQFYQFSTYMDEDSFDHQKEGIKLIEENNTLIDLDLKEQEIIKNIILNHDEKHIPEDLDDKTKLYLSIIKDADKIDRLFAMINIIPKATKEEQQIFYSNREDINKISSEILEKVLNNEIIIKQDTKTINELRIANISLVVSDIKNKPSIEIILEENYIDKVFELIDESEEKEVVYKYIKNFVYIKKDHLQLEII